MIHYTLKCGQGHRFESWFQSAAAFDKVRAAGLVACEVCGDTEIEKTLMAPAVRAARKAGDGTPPPPAAPKPDPRADALRKLREKVEANSEYVGGRFADEARAIHDGAAPERPIYGEARADEARRLIEDGVPVAPLPFIPARKTN